MSGTPGGKARGTSGGTEPPKPSDPTFAELLIWHIERGTSPGGRLCKPKGTPRAWQITELAWAMGAADDAENLNITRNFRNWRSGTRTDGDNFLKLSSAFFGDVPQFLELKNEFEDCWKNADRRAQKQNQPASPSKVTLISAAPRAIANFLNDNPNLFDAKEIQLWLYTGETLYYDLRAFLTEKGDVWQPSFRYLIQHPDFVEPNAKTDARKAIKAISRLAAAFPYIKISVRFYEQPPFARLLSFKFDDGSYRGLVGMYYVGKNASDRRYIGAEENDMVVCAGDAGYSTRLLSRYLSQYQQQWIDLTPPPRAAIFDLDGVIIDSMPIYVQAWAHALKQQGCEYSEAEMRNEVYQREGEKKSKTAFDLYKAKKKRSLLTLTQKRFS